MVFEVLENVGSNQSSTTTTMPKPTKSFSGAYIEAYE